MTDVRKMVDEITPEITDMRNYIHENPEPVSYTHLSSRNVQMR